MQKHAIVLEAQGLLLSILVLLEVEVEVVAEVASQEVMWGKRNRACLQASLAQPGYLSLNRVFLFMLSTSAGLSQKDLGCADSMTMMLSILHMCKFQLMMAST